MRKAEHKPIYLLADSQLLFSDHGERIFMRRIRAEVDNKSPCAAYIGASNGDDSRFFDLFCAAMDEIGITHRAMINSCFVDKDRASLAAADIVLLAGGDAERGWKIFNAVGLKDAILDRFFQGALLIGVSAGAVQLGLGAYASRDSDFFFNTFGLVPFFVGTHEEDGYWHNLCRAVERGTGQGKGIGVPRGGGAIYHSDHTIEPIRRHVHEFSYADGKLKSGLLLPASTVSDLPRDTESS